MASISDLRIWIQCKDHEKAIGNNAVRKIVASKLFREGSQSIKLTKSVFKKSAHQTGKSNKVQLINKYQFKDLKKFIV